MGEEGQKRSYSRSSSDGWPGKPDGGKGESGSPVIQGQAERNIPGPTLCSSHLDCMPPTPVAKESAGLGHRYWLVRVMQRADEVPDVAVPVCLEVYGGAGLLLQVRASQRRPRCAAGRLTAAPLRPRGSSA